MSKESHHFLSRHCHVTCTSRRTARSSLFVVVELFTSRIDCDRESDCHVRRYYLEYQFGSFVLLFVILLYYTLLICEPGSC